MIKPTIGRVMLFKNSSMSDQLLPALVCYVWDGAELVNLSVSNKHGNNFGITSVQVFQGDSDACPEGGCCWMPYQQEQQAKADEQAHYDRVAALEEETCGDVAGLVEMNAEGDEMLEREADVELEAEMNSNEDSIESSDDVSDDSNVIDDEVTV